eukprot:sb/3471685/
MEIVWGNVQHDGYMTDRALYKLHDSWYTLLQSMIHDITSILPLFWCWDLSEHACMAVQVCSNLLYVCKRYGETRSSKATFPDPTPLISKSPHQEPTETSKQPIRTRDWLSADQGPLFPDSVGSCPTLFNYTLIILHPRDRPTQTTNHNSLFRPRYWLSANQGPVFPDLIGSCYTCIYFS